ncbi:unnamed protein product [Wuchereria bancrofti]|uniref:Uncharacterized protein n=1 Tax=Wuchereria bancrofti TaxID=6293 RepID=A0A3P7DGS9_WUCBA|nr:unnamed protein product [Wuchereria bancrofti]
MQIFLNELKICKQKGDKMEAFVTDNRSLTIIQNHSLHLPSNLTKSIKEFNIVLKNIIVPNNECMGMVLDAKFWEKTVVLLILIVAFICFLIASIKGIQWLCGKKKPIFAYNWELCLELNSDHLRLVASRIRICVKFNCRLISSYFQICNIPDEERLLILSNNGILPMETGNDFCYVNKPYHARSKKQRKTPLKCLKYECIAMESLKQI